MSLRYARTASPFFARLDLFWPCSANEAVATRKNHPSKLANSRRVGLQSFVSKPDFPNPFVKDAKSRAAITLNELNEGMLCEQIRTGIGNKLGVCFERRSVYRRVSMKSYDMFITSTNTFIE